MRDLPDARPGDPDGRSPTRYLAWLVRRGWASLTAAVLMAILWMLCQALVPFALGRAIDAGVAGRSRGELLTWSLVLAGLGIGQAAAGIMRHRFAVVNWLAAAFRTVQVAVRQSNRLGSALPRRMSTGEVVSIGTADIEQLGSAIDIIARGTGSAVAVLTVTVILLGTSMPLGLVVVIGVPVLMAVVGLLIRPLHRRQQDYRDRQGKLTGRAADLVAGLRVLRGVGGESMMSQRYRVESQALRVAGLRTARVESLLEAAQVLLPGVFLVLVTWLGARFALEGRITVGQLVSFYAYAAFLVTPLRQLTETIDKLTRGHVAARRVVGLVAAAGDLPAGAATPAPGGELVDRVSGVRVPPGRLTALVAAVPADAVAITDRLGHYAPGSVAATLAGMPLSDLDLAELRRRVLVADNDARLFSGPLCADLDPGGTGRARDALRTAAATDVIEALPEGLESRVAERGREFSGGQQQRLRLARALVADPDVLILVEPTSSVDAHTEARIADRLAVDRRGRTTLVCTTSPLMLDRVQRVIYVEEGRVVAEGTHRELLGREPRYARTVLREED
jgi:ABC-type multidrug transport system fused ATPase/permease subunit